MTKNIFKNILYFKYKYWTIHTQSMFKSFFC